MRSYSYLLLLLLVCPNAEAQSSGTSRFIFRFAVEVGENIIANLAVDHIKNSVRWGSAGTPEGNYDEGLKQWRNGNKEDARRYMKWSAESGYSPAQLFLADVESAEGNYGIAKAWYEKAAAHQESWAEFQLGNFAYYGKIGGGADYRTALHWYRLSAGRHEVRAELMVAGILLNNRMHPISSQEASEVIGLLTDAAGRGSALGRADLGYMYLTGLGADKNVCRGLDLTRQAVTQENPVAFGNLAVMYENGIFDRPDCPLEQDRVQALELYRRAARLGENRASDVSRLERTP
jgi:TPR repeat protein